MLVKKYRANSAEIVLAREEGRLVSGSFFSFLVFNVGDDQSSRFAFIVSAKIDKRAVWRNRIKRLLRQAVREIIPQIKKGRIVLFLAKKNILGKDLEMIREEVKRMLGRAGLVRVD